MVAKRHKITNFPKFKKLWDIIFSFWDNNFLSHFSGHFEGALTFLTPKLSLTALGTIYRVKKVLAPSKCPSKRLKKLLSRKKKILSRIFLNSGTLIVKKPACHMTLLHDTTFGQLQTAVMQRN